LGLSKHIRCQLPPSTPSLHEAFGEIDVQRRHQPLILLAQRFETEGRGSRHAKLDKPILGPEIERHRRLACEPPQGCTNPLRNAEIPSPAWQSTRGAIKRTGLGNERLPGHDHFAAESAFALHHSFVAGQLHSFVMSMSKAFTQQFAAPPRGQKLSTGLYPRAKDMIGERPIWQYNTCSLRHPCFTERDINILAAWLL
jgi:hypothetical protein